MPLYDYNCAVHGAFDAFNTVRGRFHAPCPECGVNCDYSPTSPGITTTVLSGRAKAEVMEVLEHAVGPHERVPDMQTHGQVREFLRRRGFSPDGIIKTTELARRLDVPIYDHLEVDRAKR